MKTWFITGTVTGFGRTLTEKLLAQGNRVTATARKPDAFINSNQIELFAPSQYIAR
jgi:short-subunit dehydrogenase involved in D-alanine esterification of teichoic acids